MAVVEVAVDGLEMNAVEDVEEDDQDMIEEVHPGEVDLVQRMNLIIIVLKVIVQLKKMTIIILSRM